MFYLFSDFFNSFTHYLSKANRYIAMLIVPIRRAKVVSCIKFGKKHSHSEIYKDEFKTIVAEYTAFTVCKYKTKKSIRTKLNVRG